MDEPDFRRYLRREGRTEKVANEVVALMEWSYTTK